MCGLSRLDLRDEVPALMGATAMLALALAAAARYSVTVALAAIVLVALLVATTVVFVWAPHAATAVTIPLFAFIPAAKVLVTPQVGPVKDAVALCAVAAAAIYLLSRSGRRALERTDHVVLGAVACLVALYLINAGGLYSETWHGPQWVQGVRLTSEPLLLLVAGLVLPRPRRTLAWASASLIATACVIASFGILQQLVGASRLVEYGYSYDEQLRLIGPYLRSFGTLDDSFTYATFLLLALVATLFWMRRGALAIACAGLISVGIVVSFVQTAAVIALGLVALWLVRARRSAVGALLLGAAVAAGIALALGASPATQTETVQAGPSTYLTLNGRTSVWSSVFSDTRRLPLGLGVGEVGRASERARIGISEISGSPAGPGETTVAAVDSGYFAAVADVGLVGLVILFVLLGRLVYLSASAARARDDPAAWLCLGYLTVIVLDAATRDSFTAFPNAYLGLFLVGVSIAAAGEAAKSSGPTTGSR